MTKNELIEQLADKIEHLFEEQGQQLINSREHPHILASDYAIRATNILLASISNTLAERGRIEIRGFGSFSVREMAPRIGRNPKTSESVKIPKQYRAHFKPGKALRETLAQQTNKVE